MFVLFFLEQQFFIPYCHKQGRIFIPPENFDAFAPVFKEIYSKCEKSQLSVTSFFRSQNAAELIAFRAQNSVSGSPP